MFTATGSTATIIDAKSIQWIKETLSPPGSAPAYDKPYNIGPVI